LLPIGIAASTAGAQQGSVRGTVINAATSTPLRSGVVRVVGTDLVVHVTVDGRYTIPAVQAGPHVLIASALGYAPDTARVLVHIDETTKVDFGLRPAASQLDQMVVTATKTATQIRDVPAPVEVVSSETIKLSGAQTLMEAVELTTGVTPANYGENFQSIQLRGLPRLGNENETVLILIDGVPQTDARNSAQINNIPVSMIDHIEVVRGPNSALYGRTAVGGTVSIFTKNPTPRPQVDATVQAGEWGYVRGIATASGEPSDNTGYVVAVQGERHDGFQSPRIERTVSSLFAKLTNDPDDKTHISLTGNYVSNLGGTPAPIAIFNGKLIGGFYSNLNLPYAEYNQQDVRTTLKVSRTLTSAVTLDGTFAYRHSKYYFYDDGDVLSSPSPSTPFIVGVDPFTQPRNEDAYFDQVQSTANFGPRAFSNTLVAGGSFERNTGHRTAVFPDTSGGATGQIFVDYRDPTYPSQYQLQAGTPGGSAYYTTFYSGFAQDEINVFDRLHISLGLRYDLNEISAATITGSTRGPYNSGTFRKWVPKVGASYRLLEGATPADVQLNVYAQYSEGFLPPIVALDPAEVRLTPPTPEHIKNYEGGVKGSILNGLLALDVSGFFMNRDGIALQIRTGPNTYALAPGGIQKYPGVETELTSRLTSDLSLFAKYAYYGAYFGKYSFVSSGINVDYTGNRLALAPKDVVDFGGKYVTGFGLQLFIDTHFEGSRYLDQANTFLMPAYFVTNGRVAYQFRKYSVGLTIDNMFNHKYLTDGDISTAQFAFPGAPRRIVGEVGVHF
jgi:iron complex outermembrane receptor protein